MKICIVLIILVLFVLIPGIAAIAIASVYFNLFADRRYRIILGHQDPENKENNDPSKKLPQSETSPETDFENVRITGFNGEELNGFIRMGDRSLPLAVLIHGFGDNASGMYKYATLFSEAGYNILIPELRGHGKSGGRYSGLSVTDAKDINEWIKWTENRYGINSFIMFGLSLGGLVTLQYASNYNHSKLKAIITDSAPCALEPVAHNIFKWKMKCPWKPVRFCMNMIMRARLGFGFRDTSVEERISSIKVPALVIHGAKDGLIPKDHARIIYEKLVTHKELQLFDSDHTQAIDDDPLRYERIVRNFLAECNNAVG